MKKIKKGSLNIGIICITEVDGVRGTGRLIWRGNKGVTEKR